MEPKELSKVPTMEEFNKIKQALNLTDRQKEIFYLKYSRHMRIADIAEEVEVHRDTVCKDLTDIRKKVLSVEKEQLLAFIEAEELRQEEEKQSAETQNRVAR